MHERNKIPLAYVKFADARLELSFMCMTKSPGFRRSIFRDSWMLWSLSAEYPPLERHSPAARYFSVMQAC